MERFACGYCGSEMLVQRRGGTVILKAVTEAIHKVQIGTDKTAVELAIVRLNNERERLMAPITLNWKRSVHQARAGQVVYITTSLLSQKYVNEVRPGFV